MTADDEAGERRRLIGKFERTGNRAYLRAAAQLRRDGDVPDLAESDRGRPLHDDMMALRRMAALIRRGDAGSEREAARIVVTESPSLEHSREAAAERLRRKFRYFRPLFDAMAAARRQIVDANNAMAALWDKNRRRN